MPPKRKEPNEDVLLFSAPVVGCAKCYESIALPYGELPRIALAQLFDTQTEDQIELPPDGWKATFGCRACGHVSSYTDEDVISDAHRHGDAAGYHDAARLFAASFPCGNMHCKAPARVYANIESGDASEYPRLLRSGFFWGILPCGHDLATVPEKFYGIERVGARLW